MVARTRSSEISLPLGFLLLFSLLHLARHRRSNRVYLCHNSNQLWSKFIAFNAEELLNKLQALYVFNSWAGNMTLLCSSTSLMLRTIALWERKRTVVIPLGVLCLAFWAILYRTMFIVQASWSDTQETCVVTSTSPGLLNVTFFFTMAFDFTILVYTFIALITKHTARTDLWKLLFQDGLVYFVVTFTANCIPAVFNVLNLNLLMNVIATIPAAAITSIASCRAVMRLFEFTSNEVYVHSGMAQSGSGPHITRNPRISAAPQFAMARPEVIVTTEHITMSEFPSDSDSPYTVKSSRSSITGDVVEDHKGYGENARESLESTAV
ncbi:hypothetical protein D9757_000207 [Collybiopsis confluens]|uniref:Uncharacterized protein n=1 Tax=Collybiopsis confluens TaxID=2823264 RepID=A0A8H5MHH7_9AGAR|nr:hypothetical protein D9757_000207 [Collybiopsis confluens]